MTTSMQPLPGPVGFSTAHITQNGNTLILKERTSLSGDNFTVQTVDNRDVVKVEGKVVSMSGRKNFTTPDGQALFTLRKEFMSFPKAWYLETPDGAKFCYLNSKWSFGKAKIDVKFNNTAGNGQEVVLQVRGSFFDRDADILWDSKPIAKVRRDFVNFREIFGNKQTYGVEVAPGVDLALIAAIVVGLDESRNES